MALFLSTFVNKVDRKGRVSVPATFRASLGSQSFSGIVAYPSMTQPTLEASGIDRLEEIAERLEELAPASEEHEALSLIFAAVHQLAFDGEGRVVLPEPLIAHAHLGESATFVGLGKTFQIWEPKRFAERETLLRGRVKERGLSVPPKARATQ